MELPADVKAYFQRQGEIGAAKRQELLTPERRSEIARKAAATRWANVARQKKAEKKQAKKGTK
jgi:hypothetical protein